MPAMKRISEKAQRIAFKILGVPANIKNAASPEKLKAEREKESVFKGRTK